MEKKLYSKPFMMKEDFLTNNYCSACTLDITAKPSDLSAGYVRVDLDGSGTMNNENERAYERFGGLPAKLQEGNYWIAEYKAYKIVDMSLSAGTAKYEAQAAHYYDDSRYYVPIATQLIETKYGKFYFIGETYSSKNNS